MKNPPLGHDPRNRATTIHIVVALFVLIGQFCMQVYRQSVSHYIGALVLVWYTKRVERGLGSGTRELIKLRKEYIMVTKTREPLAGETWTNIFNNNSQDVIIIVPCAGMAYGEPVCIVQDTSNRGGNFQYYLRRSFLIPKE